MNEKTFKKITGKTALFTTDHQYVFAPEVQAILQECSAWNEMGHGALYKHDGLVFHVVYAYNANYWKTDGQSVATHLIVHNPKTNKACILGVLTGYSIKEMKSAIRGYKNYIKTLNKADVIAKMESHIVNYPWQSATIDKDGYGITYQDLEKATA